MTSPKTSKKDPSTRDGAPSKADFVRSQPAGSSTKEIIEKAKSEGLELTSSYVYKIRSKKKPKREKVGARTHDKGTSVARARKARVGTKTGFVVSLPAEMPAADVVEKAKAAGIALSIKHVYTIRSANRSKLHSAGAAATHGSPKATKSPRGAALPLGAKGSVESLYLKYALEVGFARATELLDRLKAKVAELTIH